MLSLPSCFIAFLLAALNLFALLLHLLIWERFRVWYCDKEEATSHSNWCASGAHPFAWVCTTVCLHNHTISYHSLSEGDKNQEQWINIWNFEPVVLQRPSWPSKAQRSLYVPHSGHYMYRQFNIQQLYVLPTQLYLCVLCGSQNKQPLFPYTTLTETECVYCAVRTGSVVTVVTIHTASLTFKNSTTFCPHSCIYVFCVDLRTNSDYFPIQH